METEIIPATEPLTDLLRLATRAHMGTSFSPERRGAAHVADYTAHLTAAKETICRLARSHDLPESFAAELFAEYAAGYDKRYRAWLHAKARCLSPMITGPANFPVRRNQKANAVEQKRCEELIRYRESSARWINKRIAQATRPEDANAAVTAEIEQMQKQLEAMKAANAIIRKKSLSQDEKLAAIVALGFDETTARKRLQPDFAGRLGFPGFELTSLRGKIERRQATARVYETVKPAEEIASSGPVTINGVEIVEDTADDRLRLIFPDKPSEEIRAMLKRNGFRWSPFNKAWQRQLTANARAAALSVVHSLAGAQ